MCNQNNSSESQTHLFFFAELDKPILHFMWKFKRPLRQNNLEKGTAKLEDSYILLSKLPAKPQ